MRFEDDMLLHGAVGSNTPSDGVFRMLAECLISAAWQRSEPAAGWWLSGRYVSVCLDYMMVELCRTALRLFVAKL